MAPCNKKGKEYTEKDDKFVDSPDELIGKDLHFLFKIVNCRGLPNKYTDVYCKYRVYLDEKVGCPLSSKCINFCDNILPPQDSATEKISLTANPDYNHKKQFDFNPATRYFTNYILLID